MKPSIVKDSLEDTPTAVMAFLFPFALPLPLRTAVLASRIYYIPYVRMS